MWIDSHCHLEFDELKNDLSGVLARARAADVGLMVAIGTTRESIGQSIALAEEHDEIYAVVGIHPHEAAKEHERMERDELVALAAHPKVIGIGETGLDYHYDFAPRAEQESLFRTHIRACIKTGLPLVIHTRDAEEDTARILAEERRGNEDRLRGVFHCYTSNEELALFGVQIDFYFSFSGIVTFKKSGNVRRVAEMVPENRLFVETDSPFLAPEPYRGKTCEPSYVVHTGECLARERGLSVAAMQKVTCENFYSLFQKVKRR